MTARGRAYAPAPHSPQVKSLSAPVVRLPSINSRPPAQRRFRRDMLIPARPPTVRRSRWYEHYKGAYLETSPLDTDVPNDPRCPKLWAQISTVAAKPHVVPPRGAD